MKSADTTEGSKKGEASATKALTVRINPWWLSAFLVVVIAVLVFLWRPWDAAPAAGDRTIRVSGSATVMAEPDKYVFVPRYKFQNADKAAGLAELTAHSEAVVAGLKKAGVADKDIKTDVNGHRNYYRYDNTKRLHVYMLRVTATVQTRKSAQKVQDYLVTTNPSGSVTPRVEFSTAKRKELESKGRLEATKEARAKAEQQAEALGFRIGKVKNVEDSDFDYGYPVPYTADMKRLDGATEHSSTSLTVQPGENELSYSVRVTYYIK
ncbi:hypothetical protein CR973_03090 [Candidatus Saccharibacteria bacterium]|nr:MAG: hypothetical protein CR973_03090 [Candidatus Saccharibacteria bacterium]